MSQFPSTDRIAHSSAELPAVVPSRLIGRESVLAPVYAQLKGGRPVLVYGSPGVGKTAVAATLANAYAQQSGGVLWLNVESDSLDSLLVRIGRAYQLTEVTQADNPLAMLGTVAATLLQHKPFIVLDGKLDAQVAAKFITRCADRLPTLLVSRELIEGPWTPFRLSPLEPPAAMTLFKQDAAILQDDFDADIGKIVETVSYQPFAIGVVARALLASKQTPTAYQPILAQVAAQGGGTPAHIALTAAFAPLNSALQGLLLVLGATFRGEASAELLSLISGAPEESIHQAMNLLYGLKLVERYPQGGEPYYRLHALTYAFAQERLNSSGRLDALHAKTLEMTLVYATRHNEAGNHAKIAQELLNIMAAARWAAGKGNRETATQLSQSVSRAFADAHGYNHERAALRAIVGVGAAFPAHPQEPTNPSQRDIFAMIDEIDEDSDEIDALAPEDGLGTVDEDDDYTDALADDYDDDDLEYLDDEDEGATPITSVFDMLDTMKDTDDAPVEQFSAVTEPDDEDAADDPDDFSAALDFDGDSEPLAFDEPDEVGSPEDLLTGAARPPEPTDELARLKAAVLSARQAGDTARQVAALVALGKAQVVHKQETEALLSYSEALNLYESLNNPHGALEAIEMLAALMEKTGNAQAAILHAGRGVKLAGDLGDADTQMQLLITLGDAYQQTGESDNAAQSYSRALEIARNRNDAQHEALILYKLGYAQLDGGDSATAIDNWEQALTLFRGQGKRDYEGKVLGGLGSAYGELERWAEAINFHTSALYIAREVGDKDEEALQLASLGYACVQGNQLSQAVLRYRQALHLAYQAGDRHNIVGTLVDLVRLLGRSPRHLTVCELLINDALTYDPKDREVAQLAERVASEKQAALAGGVQMVSVHGSAQQYAENAYRLLDD